MPQYYVFYNGLRHEPDKRIMKLSEAFLKIEGKEPCLECTATLLNINYGHNILLMEKCKQLKDYSAFIYYIRRNQQKGFKMQEAVDLAIDECIKKDILKKLLVKCRGEVRNMVLSSFNREVYERDLRAEGREEGRLEGIREGIREGQEMGEFKKLFYQVFKKLKKNRSPEVIAEELEEELPVIMKICDTLKDCNGETDFDSILEQILKNRQI